MRDGVLMGGVNSGVQCVNGGGLIMRDSVLMGVGFNSEGQCINGGGLIVRDGVLMGGRV